MKTPNTPATIKSFRIFEDGSDVEALISYQGFTFAFHYAGRASMNLVSSHQYVSHRTHRLAVRYCRLAYMQLLALNVTPEWYALNKAMYADEVKEGKNNNG